MSDLTDAIILLAAGTVLLVVSVVAMFRLRRHLEQQPRPVSAKRLAELHVIDVEGEL